MQADQQIAFQGSREARGRAKRGNHSLTCSCIRHPAVIYILTSSQHAYNKGRKLSLGGAEMGVYIPLTPRIPSYLLHFPTLKALSSTIMRQKVEEGSRWWERCWVLPRLCRPGVWSRLGWWATFGRSPELHNFRFLLCLEWSCLAISERPPSSKTLQSLELTPISEDLSSYYSADMRLRMLRLCKCYRSSNNVCTEYSWLRRAIFGKGGRPSVSSGLKCG